MIVLVNRARRGMGMDGVGDKPAMDGSLVITNSGGLDEVTIAVGRNDGVLVGVIVGVLLTFQKELTLWGTAALIGLRTKM